MLIRTGCSEQLERAVAFAKSVGAYDGEDGLKAMLDYLDTYAEHGDRGKTHCRLFPDFMGPDLNFAFTMLQRNDRGDYDLWFNGGLIYSGPGQPCDGSGPNFTVSANPDAAAGRRHMWSVHT